MNTDAPEQPIDFSLKYRFVDKLEESLYNNLDGYNSGFALDISRGEQVWLETIGASKLVGDAKFRLEHDCWKLVKTDCQTLRQPLDIGVEDDFTYLVFESLPGESLCELDTKGFSLDEKLGFAIDLLSAVKTIHEASMVHGNISAANVFIDGSIAQLGGLGYERYVNPSSLDRDNALHFSAYVSPEFSGALVHDIGPASDLYSIGAILFCLFTGQSPFNGRSVSEMLFQHLTVDPPLAYLPKELPGVLVDLLKVLLKKDPPERYQTASSVIFDIECIRKLLKEGDNVDRFVICSHEIKPVISDPAFVGRADEMKLLTDKLEEVKQSKSQSVLVSAPSGMGKSRLILEFMRKATRRNFTVLRGRGSNEAGSEPMAPLLEVIRQLGERVSGDAEQVERILKGVEGHEKEIASVSHEFAESVQLSHDGRIDGPDEFGQSRIENALAKLLANAASDDLPILVWIDDCQWLDEQSLKVLSGISENASDNLLLLSSMRSECGETLSKFKELVVPDATIELGPLKPGEVQMLQRSMTGPLPEAAERVVVKHAFGNPFMASAVVRGMFESQAIKPHSDGWKLDNESFQHIQAAGDAAQILLQRLQQLPADTIKLLSIAAIIGKEFDAQAVAEICGIKDFERHLRVAHEKRLTWSTPNRTLSFVHDKIREALIERMPADEKRALHQKLAEYFELNRSDRVFDLAFHFDRAELPERALPFAMEAARIARGRFSLGVAELQLEIAAKGLMNSSSETQYQVHSLASDVAMLDGRYDESEKWLSKAVGLTTKPIEKAQIVFKKGQLEFKRGNKVAAVEHFEQALKDLGHSVPSFVFPSLLGEVLKQAMHSILPSRFVGTSTSEATEEDRVAWQLFSKLAQGYWYTRDKYSTLWSHLRGMNLAERFQPTAELAQAYSEHAPAMSLLPWHSRGLDYAERSLAIRKEFGDVWGQGQSRNFKAILQLSAANFEGAIDQGRRAMTVLERTGDYWEIHIARYQYAAALYRTGDLKAAVREARETYKSALELGDHQATGYVIDLWARAGLHRIPDEVVEREKARGVTDMQTRCQVLLADGVRLIGKDEFIAAADRFREAVECSKKSGVVNTYITPNYAWLATALRLEIENHPTRSAKMAKQRVRAYGRAAKAAVKVARKYKSDLPHALRELAIARALSNRASKARKSIKESIAVARKLGAEYELAKSELIWCELKDDFGWKDSSVDKRRAEHRLHEIEKPIVDEQKMSISILDRFENLLDAGRQISSASSIESITQTSTKAAKRLLRGQRAFLVTDLFGSNPSSEKVDRSLVRQSAEEAAAIITDRETLSDKKAHSCDGSYLACPIVVNDHVHSVLYVANDSVQGLFGDDEKKIAEFLTAATGAAFQKAENFQRLEEMNRDLEQRVQDRTAVVRARSLELEQTADALRTTQKSLELARDTAENANQVKTNFLANMSHEIRTPIAAIIGFAELILRGVVGPEERMAKIETIHASGKHLLRLISNLLDLSKVEADQIELESLPFSPYSIVFDVVESLRASAMEKTIELKMEVSGLVPRSVQNDPTRFRQVVTNLVGNAIKFTEKGSVIVRVGHTRAGECGEYDFENGRLTVSIEDTGIGMTDDQIEHIFDPFTQADSSITRKFGGTGLGLSISKRLAEKMGGEIRVESVPGFGSCFSVNLLTSPDNCVEFVGETDLASSNQTATLEEIKWLDLSDKHILIVDDAKTNREFLALILRDTNAKLTMLENGQEAVNEFVAGRSFDVVLMDMQMPILDGYSATQEIRRLGFNTPIIAFTANSMSEDRTKCLDAGCSDYLSKPVDTVTLMQKLASSLSSVGKAKNNSQPTKSNYQNENSSAKCAGIAVSNKNQVGERVSLLALEYLESLVSCFTDFENALMEENFQTLENLGHSVKGTASMVGLDELSQAGRKLDGAAKAYSIELANEAVSEIGTLLEL